MYLFDYLGAFYYWVFLVIRSKIRRRKAPAFSDIREGKGKYIKGNIVDKGAYGLKLKTIGVIITMLILHLIVKYGI